MFNFKSISESVTFQYTNEMFNAVNLGLVNAKQTDL